MLLNIKDQRINNMKILLVNKFHYRKGGAETYYFTLAEALKARGHEVVFFSMKDEKNEPCEQEKYFVSNASVNGSIPSRVNMAAHIAYSKEAYRNMTRLLRDKRPDLVWLNNIHRQITLSVIDAVKDFDPKLPIFWTMHDLMAACPAYVMLDGNGKICEECLDGNYGHCVKNRCIKGSRLMGLLAKYEADFIRRRGLYDKVDLYICPSEFNLRMLRRAGFTKSQMVMMRNPLPLGTNFELSGSGDYVLYFGRLSREKGVRTLIDAVRQVGYRTLILGTGPLEAELKAYVKANQIQNVEFKGYQSGETLTGYIQRSRCVIVPSEWYENCPYSAMEAMALGKPLIVSDCGGLPELVEDGKNGYVYAADSEDLTAALASCISRMMALPQEEYRKMAQNSFIRAEAQFNAARYIDKMEYYFSLSGKGRRNVME